MNTSQHETIKRTFTEKEAADYIGMSTVFLRRSRSEGNREGRTPAPPFVKIGKSVRYLAEDLEGFLRQNRRECM